MKYLLSIPIWFMSGCGGGCTRIGTPSLPATPSIDNDVVDPAQQLQIIGSQGVAWLAGLTVLCIILAAFGVIPVTAARRFVTGGVVGILACGATFWLGEHWDIIINVIVIMCGLTVALYLIASWQSILYWAEKYILKRDINGDNVIGKPPEEEE